MYKIIVKNKVLGYTVTPLYIKVAENGCFVNCRPAEAQGISYLGSLYPVVGHTEIPGDCALVNEVSEAELLQILNSSTTSTVNALATLLGEV